MSNSLISDKKINCSRQAELILSVSHPISVHLRGSALMRCVKQTSIHLNENFVIQWILIGNLFCIYRTFETPDIPLGWVIVGILIALTTGLILYVHLKKERCHQFLRLIEESSWQRANLRRNHYANQPNITKAKQLEQ